MAVILLEWFGYNNTFPRLHAKPKSYKCFKSERKWPLPLRPWPPLGPPIHIHAHTHNHRIGMRFAATIK